MYDISIQVMGFVIVQVLSFSALGSGCVCEVFPFMCMFIAFMVA